MLLHHFFGLLILFLQHDMIVLLSIIYNIPQVVYEEAILFCCDDDDA
jgi:5-bromo-4-chloroindolyl phosphate hydrolysis protein